MSGQEVERGLPLLEDIISAYLFVTFSFDMQYMYIYMSICVMVGWTMITSLSLI